MLPFRLMTRGSLITQVISIGVLSLHSVSAFGTRNSLRFNSNRVVVDEKVILGRHRTMVKVSLEKSDQSEEEDEENLARWEEMYFGTGDDKLTETDEESIKRSEIRVVTFDLDNTIWKTSKTIDAANEALATFLDANSIIQPKRVEKIMGDLFQQDKKRYAPLDDNPKAPVLLTQLRIDAIKNVLENFNGYSEDNALQLAKEAFEVWTRARHSAIPEHFANNVLSCLKKISSITTSSGQPVVIGAITDGNSDPRNVELLKDFFEFCVNAEMVGVAKPDKRVYMEAVRRIVSHPSLQNLGRTALDSDDDLENSIGPYWVHIGDDFSKDIVPAKQLKMRTIWSTELIREKLQKTKNEENDQVENREVGGFMKDIAEREVIEMPIGADSYLADSLTQEFVDVVAQQFNELGEILFEWHSNAEQSNKVMVDSGDSFSGDNQAEEIDESGNDLFNNSSDVSDEDNFLSSTTLSSRTFRLMREDFSMDVPAPLKKRETLTMKDVMTMAQLDKSSGVFSFPPEDIKALQNGQKILMIEIGDTGIKFSREIFVGMTIEEILLLTDENPVRLSLYTQEAVDSPSFNLF